MKNVIKPKKSILIPTFLIFLIIFNVGTFINGKQSSNTQLYDLKNSAGSISINGNEAVDDFFISNGTEGSSWSDVYIIENLIFIGSGSGIGIHIENSNRFIVIYNCSFYNWYNGIDLFNVTNLLVLDCEFSDNSNAGIGSYFCKDNIFAENDIYGNGQGIFLLESTHIEIQGNTIHLQNSVGINLQKSNTTRIIDNEIFENPLGLLLDTSSNTNEIIENAINENIVLGIMLSNSEANRIFDNDIESNPKGISVSNAFDNYLMCNIFLLNDIGIELTNSADINIIGNEISYSSDYGIKVDGNSNDNRIYLNSFIENDNIYAESLGSPNLWDNDGEDGVYIGNYWADYGERYPDAIVNGDGWVMNISYEIIGGVEVDRYPLKSLDVDDDTIPNHEEIFFNTDPCDPDSDDDGLNDAIELGLGTNPLDSDTDDDGLHDGWEVWGDIDPLDPDGDADPDQDGLTNLGEYNHGTHPSEYDTDGDTMPDGWEVDFDLDPNNNTDSSLDSDTDGLVNLDEYKNYCDPLDPDTDGDGMPDGWEVWGDIDPINNDANTDLDNDGLTNLEEYTYGSHPNENDTDGDGLDDGTEVNTEDTDPNNPDSDGDGLNDGTEVNTENTDPNIPDSDGDGLNDGTEVNTENTDPNNPDSDGDGYSDGVEVNASTDPLDPNDYPISPTDEDGNIPGYDIYIILGIISLAIGIIMKKKIIKMHK